MSTAWLNEILRENQLTEEDKNFINRAFSYFQNLLQNHPENPVIRKTGSQAKNIAVHSKFDLDILVTIPQNHQIGVHDFYYSVLNFLKENNQNFEQKDAAITCSWKDRKIDVVPAKWIDNNYLNIWKSRESNQMRTSIDKQIEKIDSYGARNIFKLVKIWKIKQKLKGPSYLFELYTIRAIEAMDQGIWDSDNLGSMMLEIFDYFYKTANEIKLVDISNSNNVISDLWDDNERIHVKNAAFLAIQIMQDDEDFHMVF